MTERLQQHIYTSTGRMNFETVAISPGVSGEVLKQLEAHAQSYPTKAASGDGPAPYVVRGFRLVGHDGAADFAVSLSFYVGRSLSSPEGNYLSHSYVIPRGLLARHGYNLPWLAACLPCHFKYYPVRGSGADALDALAFDLDPSRQFTLFSFVARELTEDRLRDLLWRLVQRAVSAPGEQTTLNLELPPPHAELGRIHQEVMGMPPETKPGPDALRLLRLAGSLAILPDAFKQDPTFTVNDSAPAAGRTQQDAYAVHVARAEAAAAPSKAPETWAWFDHCTWLALENRLEELSEMCALLSRLLPAGRSPLLKALDTGFNFYQFWRAARRPAESPEAGRGAPVFRELVERVGDFANCDVDLDALYDSLLQLLEQGDVGYEDRCDLCVALCKVAATTGSISGPAPCPPPRVFAAVKECLWSPPVPNDAARLRFWHRLPESTQFWLWESTYRDGQPPGRIPSDDSGRPDPHHLNFALTTFKPDLLRNSLQARNGIVEHLGECLLHPMPGAARFYFGLRRQELAGFLSGLDVLLNLRDCDDGLLKLLLRRLVDQFYSALRGDQRGKELTQIVNDALNHLQGVNVTVLNDLVRHMAVRDRAAVFDLLRSLSLEPEHRRRSRDFLHTLGVGYISDLPLQLLVRVLNEMGEVLDRPEICADQTALSALPRLNEMCVQLEQLLDDRRDLLRDAQRALLPALRQLQPVERFCVGTAYLWIFCPFDDGLFEQVMAALRDHGAEIAQWSLSDRWQAPLGRSRSLGRFLHAVDNSFGNHLKTAFEYTLNALSWLGDNADRRALLAQLDFYLKDTNASGRLKEAVQNELRRFGGERRR